MKKFIFVNAVMLILIFPVVVSAENYYSKGSGVMTKPVDDWSWNKKPSQQQEKTKTIQNKNSVSTKSSQSAATKAGGGSGIALDPSLVNSPAMISARVKKEQKLKEEKVAEALPFNERLKKAMALWTGKGQMVQVTSSPGKDDGQGAEVSSETK